MRSLNDVGTMPTVPPPMKKDVEAARAKTADKDEDKDEDKDDEDADDVDKKTSEELTRPDGLVNKTAKDGKPDAKAEKAEKADKADKADADADRDDGVPVESAATADTGRVTQPKKD